MIIRACLSDGIGRCALSSFLRIENVEGPTQSVTNGRVHAGGDENPHCGDARTHVTRVWFFIFFSFSLKKTLNGERLKCSSVYRVSCSPPNHPFYYVNACRIKNCKHAMYMRIIFNARIKRFRTKRVVTVCLSLWLFGRIYKYDDT